MHLLVERMRAISNAPLHMLSSIFGVPTDPERLRGPSTAPEMIARSRANTLINRTRSNTYQTDENGGAPQTSSTPSPSPSTEIEMSAINP